MTPDQAVAALWRRRRVFLVTLVLTLVIVAVLVAVLPRTYRATATLFVSGPSDDAATAEQLTRTYAALAGNPNVAEQARREMPFGISRRKLLEHMSFVPVERTQLIELSAEFGTRARAQAAANVYARTFARRVQARRGTNAITVSELASRPSSAVRPNPPLYLAFGAILAVVLAAIAAITRDALDRRVRPDHGGGELHGAEVVATIPSTRPGARGDRLVFEDAHRVLRATADRMAGGHARVIAIAGSDADDGAATVATGLGLVAGIDNERAVVVEADLRRPRLDRWVSGSGAPPREERGLAAFLERRAAEDEIVAFDEGRLGFDVIWSGQVTTSPGALVASARMTTLIDWLAGQYDRVILLAPPVLVGADAATLAARADAALLVVDAKRTSNSAAREDLEQLRTLGVARVGVVLVNGARRAVPGYYGPATPERSTAPEGQSARVRTGDAPG